MKYTTSRLAILACLAVVAVLGTRGVRAQGAALIKVDFLAVGTDGRPVTDLKPEQISLKVAGKDRAIKSLELVRATDDTVSAAPVLPEPFGSNAGGATGRNVLFVVEDEALKAGVERQVRDAVSQMLTGLTPRDRVSLAVVPRGAVRVDATTNHAALNDALTKVIGRMTSEGTEERACRSRDTLDAFRNVLAAAGGGPTTVVFFSSSLAGQNRGGGTGGSNRCELTTADFQKVAAAVDTAHATLYVVNPDTSANTNQDGLENLAGVSGGQFTRLASDANPLSRIVTETSAYYLVGFEPDAADRPGQMQRLDLKVTREGVTTRARADVTIARGGGSSGAPSPRDLVRGTQVMKDLPLRATAYTSMDADGLKMKVLVAFETDPGTKLASAAIGAYDSTSKLTVWTAVAEDLAKPMVIAALSLPKGALRVRVAATDGGGRAGTVDTTVTADVTPAGPLQLSGLVLGSAAGGGFAPKLLFTAADAEAIAYFEIYGANPNLPLETLVEVASTMDGPTIVSSPVKLGAAGVDRYNAQAVVPIDKLAPGDYVVRAKFTVQGHPTGIVTRTLRKAK